ncbi:MAG TPA: hypothetical protein VGG48_01950 [Rhizomicrobium sp.]|jgi:nucleoside phosphorylase
MKILIAEDNGEKIKRLISLLTKELEIDGNAVHIAQTIFDARRELRDVDFDLLILDVLLPNRAGDSPTHTGTVALLEELSARRTLRKPSHILGLTAYDDAIRDAGPAFIKRTWTVVRFAFESDEWKSQVAACVGYIRETLAQEPKPDYGSDLCLITALPAPEFEAVVRLPWSWKTPVPLDDTTFVRRGQFTSSGHTFSVVAASASKVGMVSSALLASKLILRERPKFVVMVGICAGMRGKTNFGDVIFGDPVWNWQSGKHFVGSGRPGFAIEPDPLPLPSFVRARVDQLKSAKDVASTVRAGWAAGPPETELKFRIGPVATGSSVLANSDIVQSIVEQNRSLLGIEMEAYGVMAAASIATRPRPVAFTCKSVCDFADELKDDRWQTYAAYTSCEAVRAFFEKYMCEINDLVPESRG